MAMPENDTSLRKAANHARHIASQLKQLQLRNLAGHEPTIQQLDHVHDILADLAETLDALDRLAENRHIAQLKGLTTYPPPLQL
jgi:hypothetical protein